MSEEEQSSEEKGSEGKSEEAAAAESAEEEREDAKEEIKKLEENPPERLEDWPKGAAKYETFGGPEGQHGYEEGPEKKLGPSSVRHLEGGEVTVAGEKADNPDEFKGEPIPGGATDPNAPDAPGEQPDPSDEGGDDSSGGEESSGGEGGSDDEEEK